MYKIKPLRILFMPEWYPSEDNKVFGVFNKEYAKAVSIYNEVVVIYCEGCDKKLRKIWGCISDQEEEGIRVIRFKYRKYPIPKITYIIYLWSIKQIFNKLVNDGWKPDIIHAHVYSSGVPAVILGILYAIPVAISEHYSIFPLRKLNLIEKMKAKFAMNRANIILPVSKALEKSIKSYGIKNDFDVISNTVNTGLFYQAFKK